MKQNYLIAITSKITNGFLFSVITLMLIHYTKLIPVEQVLFLRSALGVVVSVLFLIILKQPINFKLEKKDIVFYSARGLISFVAMLLWIWAIQYVGVHEATALGYTSPFWVFLSASLVMKERFNKLSLLAIATSMFGVIIVFKPSVDNISFEGIILGIGSIMLWVVYETICKKQTSDQHYMMQSFYVLFFTSIITAPFALTKWQAMDFETWKIFFVLATLSVGNITSIFLAYSYAPMMVVSPFSYMRLIFTAILTAVLYNNVPSKEVFIGAAIILIANSLFAYASSKKNRV